MSRDDLETKLSNARAELRALEAELPTFIKWRDGHQGRVDGARAGRAGPELLAEATGRLNTANELLSQHESDIRAAAEFVADCERDLERLDICERIRAADYELTYARQPWLEDALATCNSFIESATRLGEERRRLKSCTMRPACCGNASFSECPRSA